MWNQTTPSDNGSMPGFPGTRPLVPGSMRYPRETVFLGRAVCLLLFLHPIFNTLVYGTTPFFTNAGIVLNLRLSDLLLLAWLIPVGTILILSQGKQLLRDPWIAGACLYLGYRIVRDRIVGATEGDNYVPSSALLIVAYGAASCAVISSRDCFIAVCFNVVYYAIMGVLGYRWGSQLDGRMQSVFSNPNFLAFHMLNLMVLVDLLVRNQRGSRLTQMLAAGTILLSRTRSALAALVIFLFRFPRKWRFVLLAGGVAAAVAAPWLLRMDENNSLFTLNARIPMWQTVLDNRGAFDWVWGSGNGAIKESRILPIYSTTGTIEGYFQPQSEYLLQIAEVGVVGMGIWIVALMAYIGCIWPWRFIPEVRTIMLFIAMLMFIQFVECDMFHNVQVALIMGLGMARTRQHIYRCPVPAITGKPIPAPL